MMPWSAGRSGNAGSMATAVDGTYRLFTTRGTTSAIYVSPPETWAGSSTSMESPNIHNDSGSGGMVMKGVVEGAAVTAPQPRGWSRQTPQAPHGIRSQHGTSDSLPKAHKKRSKRDQRNGRARLAR